MFKTISNILTTTNILVNKACVMTIKASSATEDLLDTVNVHTTNVLNETLEDNNVTMAQLEAKYRARMDFMSNLEPKK